MLDALCVGRIFLTRFRFNEWTFSIEKGKMAKHESVVHYYISLILDSTQHPDKGVQNSALSAFQTILENPGSFPYLNGKLPIIT
jgi:hypothetical protein